MLTYIFHHSIVAVHGLNGNAIQTWTSDSDEAVCWLSHPDFLPKYVGYARVLTWGYNANVSSSKGKMSSSDRVLQHAQTLISQLHADREVSCLLINHGEIADDGQLGIFVDSSYLSSLKKQLIGRSSFSAIHSAELSSRGYAIATTFSRRTCHANHICTARLWHTQQAGQPRK
jgi:hypothetical protein